MKKIVFLVGVFVLLSFVAKASEIQEIFMEAYVKKDAELMVRAMIPPQPFLSELEKYEAKKGKVTVEKIREDMNKAKSIQMELMRDCVFKYLPIKNYEELKSIPSTRLQKIFYVHVLEDDERFYFQDKISCKKHLFKTASPNKNTRLVFLEVCKVEGGIRPWIDRLAIFGKEANFAMLGCVIEKIKKLKETK